jgi:hypothetical protein
MRDFLIMWICVKESLVVLWARGFVLSDVRCRIDRTFPEVYLVCYQGYGEPLRNPAGGGVPPTPFPFRSAPIIRFFHSDVGDYSLGHQNRRGG